MKVSDWIIYITNPDETYLEKINYNNFCKPRVSRQFGILVSIDSFLNDQTIIVNYWPKNKNKNRTCFFVFKWLYEIKVLLVIYIQ